METLPPPQNITLTGRQQGWGKDCSTAGESHNSQDTCGPSLKMPRRCLWSVKFPQMEQEAELVGSSEKQKVEEEQQSIFEKHVYTQASSNPPTSPHTHSKTASVISLPEVPQCPLLPFLLRVLPLAIFGLGLIYYVMRWQIKNEINKYLKQMHFWNVLFNLGL